MRPPKQWCGSDPDFFPLPFRPGAATQDAVPPATGGVAAAGHIYLSTSFASSVCPFVRNRCGSCAQRNRLCNCGKCWFQQLHKQTVPKWTRRFAQVALLRNCRWQSNLSLGVDAYKCPQIQKPTPRFLNYCLVQLWAPNKHGTHP